MAYQQPSGVQKNDGFPYKQLTVLALCRLAEPIAFCSILAYSFVMVEDIKGKEDASFYSGLLVSAFAVAEACTALFWGELSDRYGRKPIIMVALAGTAISSLVFGFAKNYWVALGARAIGGLLNGNQAVLQTMVAEMVTNPEHEPRAYAIQPIMWSLGSIAGSSLGGFTAQPARFFPGVFSKDGLFGEYPYLLPNLVAVGIILIAMIQGMLFLEETAPNIVSKRQPKIPPPPPSPIRRRHVIDERTPLHRPSVESFQHRRRRPSSIMIATSAPLLSDPMFDLRRPSIASVTSIRALFKDTHVPETNSVFESSIFEENVEAANTHAHPTKTFTTEVLLWIIALCIMAFHQMAFSSILPIYLLDDPRQPQRYLDLIGGLNKTLPEVGTFLAVNSIIALFIQAVVFPFFVSWLGVWYAAIALTIFCPFALALMPFVSLLPSPMLGAYIVMSLESFCCIIIWPCVLILLKNATPSPVVLGRVNGLAMSGCSAVRTIAPPLAGIIYSSVGSAASWWFCAAAALFATLELWFIPRPVDNEVEIMRRASVCIDE